MIIWGVAIFLLGPVWLHAIQEANGVQPTSDFLRQLGARGDSFWESWFGEHLMQMLGLISVATGATLVVRKYRCGY